jgi:hypothetical protein
MKTVILGGPALALDNSIRTRHYTIVDIEDSVQIATIVFDIDAKTRNLIIHRTGSSEGPSEEITSAVCRLMKAVAPNYVSVPITADDSNAVALAFLLSGNVTSSDPDIVAAWTSLNFELEMSHTQRDGTTNKLRFTGANIRGMKDISTADTITLTVTPKKK